MTSDTTPETLSTLSAHLGILAHLRVLENSTIYALQEALREGLSAPDALLRVFKPSRYLWETLVSIKVFIEDYLAIEAVRAAVFVPDEGGKNLVLAASVADMPHSARPLDEKSIARRAFDKRASCVWADTTKGSFPFLDEAQQGAIGSHISLPILERRLIQPGDKVLPIPADLPWGDPQGVLCLDSRTPDDFDSIAKDGGQAITKILDPLISDLYVGLLFSYLKGWKK